MATTARLALIVVLLTVACASTNLAPIGSSNSFVPEPDEEKLWAASRQAEQRVLPRSAVFEDAQLDDYLTALAARVTPASYRAAGGNPIRVHIRKDPRLNAFAMPHGLVVLHTSVVARAQNEAQLAGVLAHEITHITHRHQIRAARALQNRQTGINIAGFLGMLALTVVAIDQAQRGNPETAEAIVHAGTPLLSLGLQLTQLAMVNGYSRDLEREADEEGMRRMAAQGYRPAELAQLFRVMLADQPDRGRIETFFYGNHPRMEERIETVDRLAPSLPVAGDAAISSADFDRRLVRVRIANAQYDAFVGRMSLARTEMATVLTTMPATARPMISRLLTGHLLGSAAMGAFRRRDEATGRRLFDGAEHAYRDVATKAPSYPGGTGIAALAYKSLGYLYGLPDVSWRQCDAKMAFEKYLELQPTASDSLAIRNRISGLKC